MKVERFQGNTGQFLRGGGVETQRQGAEISELLSKITCFVVFLTENHISYGGRGMMTSALPPVCTYDCFSPTPPSPADAGWRVGPIIRIFAKQFNIGW